MLRNNLVAVAFAVVCGVLVPWVSLHMRRPETPPPPLIRPANRGDISSLYLTTLDGEPTSLTRFRGSVILVNIWATWCAPCRTELPMMSRLSQQFSTKSRNRFTVVGVSTESKDGANVAQFVASHGISYPIALAEEAEISRTLGHTPSIPVTLLLDAQGRIAYSHVGIINESEVQEAINALLREPA